MDWVNKKMVNKKLKGDPRQIVSFFTISHGIPFILTIAIMLLGKVFYITNKLNGRLIYLSLLSPSITAMFVVYFFTLAKNGKTIC